MATVNQAYFQEGKIINGSPEGTVWGELGNTIYDIDNSDTYEALGGTKWKLISKNSKPLYPRIIDKFSNLPELSRIEIGEGVNNPINGTYIKRTDQTTKYINAGKDTILPKITIMKWVGSRLFPAGTIVSITFRVPSGMTGNAISQSFINFENSKCVYRFVPVTSEKRIRFVPQTGNTINPKCFLDDGTEITDLNYAPMDEWLTFSFEMASDVDVVFSRGVWLGGAITDGLDFQIRSWSIGSENFAAEEGVGESVTGTEGTVFTNTDVNPVIWEDLDTLSTKYTLLNGDLYSVPIKNSIITPQLLGYDETLNDDFNFTNDAHEILQRCIDSNFAVEIPPGNYYISKPLVVTKAKHIKMFGQASPWRTFSVVTPIDFEEYYTANKGTTVIYSDQNIDYFDIRASRVFIQNGVVLTAFTPDHTRAGYLMNLNYDLWGFELRDVTVYGNNIDAAKEGIGTKGIYFNTDEVARNEGEIGYATMGNLTGKIFYCHTGLHIPPGNDLWYNQGYYMNSITTKFEMKSCKRFFYVSGCGNSTYRGNIQAGSVGMLVGDETSWYAHEITGSNCHIDIDDIDGNRSNRALFSGRFCTYSGKTMYRYLFGGYFKIPSLGSVQSVVEPFEYRFLDTGGHEGFLSALQNPYKYIGDQDATVTYGAFKAPSQDWLSENPVDSLSEGLTEDTSFDSTLITMAGSNFLTSNYHRLRGAGAVYFTNRHSLGYLEIRIKDIPSHSYSSIRQIMTNLSKEGSTQAQYTIIYAATYDNVVVDAGLTTLDFSAYGSFQIREGHAVLIQDPTSGAFEVVDITSSNTTTRIATYISRTSPSEITPSAANLTANIVATGIIETPRYSIVKWGPNLNNDNVKELIVRFIGNTDQSTGSFYYDYQTPTISVDPLEGQIIHSDDDLSTLKVHNVNAAGNNISATILNQVGAFWIYDNHQWLITSVTSIGDYIEVGLSTYNDQYHTDGEMTIRGYDYEAVTVEDIATVTRYTVNTPYIRSAGNQRVYGELGVTTLAVPTPITDGSVGSSTVSQLETKLNTLITELKANIKAI